MTNASSHCPATSNKRVTWSRPSPRSSRVSARGYEIKRRSHPGNPGFSTPNVAEIAAQPRPSWQIGQRLYLLSTARNAGRHRVTRLKSLLKVKKTAVDELRKIIPAHSHLDRGQFAHGK
jgi:hypothetical protein